MRTWTVYFSILILSYTHLWHFNICISYLRRLYQFEHLLNHQQCCQDLPTMCPHRGNYWFLCCCFFSFWRMFSFPFDVRCSKWTWKSYRMFLSVLQSVRSTFSAFGCVCSWSHLAFTHISPRLLDQCECLFVMHGSDVVIQYLMWSHFPDHLRHFWLGKCEALSHLREIVLVMVYRAVVWLLYHWQTVGFNATKTQEMEVEFWNNVRNSQENIASRRILDVPCIKHAVCELRFHWWCSQFSRSSYVFSR